LLYGFIGSAMNSSLDFIVF